MRNTHWSDWDADASALQLPQAAHAMKESDWTDAQAQHAEERHGRAQRGASEGRGASRLMPGAGGACSEQGHGGRGKSDQGEYLRLQGTGHKAASFETSSEQRHVEPPLIEWGAEWPSAAPGLAGAPTSARLGSTRVEPYVAERDPDRRPPKRGRTKNPMPLSASHDPLV